MSNLFTEFQKVFQDEPIKIGLVLSKSGNSSVLKDMYNKEFTAIGTSVDVDKRAIIMNGNIITEAPDFVESTEWV